jgi:hypothetical protein
MTSPPAARTSPASARTARGGTVGRAFRLLAATLPLGVAATAGATAPDRTTAPASRLAAEIDWLRRHWLLPEEFYASRSLRLIQFYCRK